MKFSVRIPILNFRKYSAQVQVTPENSESTGILVLHSDSETYAAEQVVVREYQAGQDRLQRGYGHLDDHRDAELHGRPSPSFFLI